MILPVNNFKNITFSANNDKRQKYNLDTPLNNNVGTRTRIGFDKLSNAFTLYPIKGLKGDKNANFYEFLSMGIVPYLIGSVTMMSVFNTANKHFCNYDSARATAFGRKMALGVLFYGIMKSISKSFINMPVKFLTGVDTSLPYAKVIYELPEYVNDTDITSIEYHNVFESVDFPRWDLLYGDEAKGEKRNKYYDNLAQKLGLGTNLNDSDQEVKPVVKQIVVRSTMARHITTFLWGALGVAYAMQKPWDKAFEKLFEKGSFERANMQETMKVFKEAIQKSFDDLYHGIEDKKWTKYSGKAIVLLPAILTVLGILHTITGLSKPAKNDASDVIKRDKKYMVN